MSRCFALVSFSRGILLRQSKRGFVGRFQKTTKFFLFLCFSVSKSSKSHPTDSDVGVRRTESGVGRLRGFASKPSPPLSLSAFRPLFRHRNQVGTRLAGKEEVMDIEVRCQIK